MSKFNKGAGRTMTGPLTIEREPSTITAEGGAGFTRDARSDLFLLAVSNMVGTDTFYEGATDRDKRFRELIHAVAPANIEWMKGFIGWLRNDANMRSASVVAAAETAKAMLDVGLTGSRSIVSSALLRPDEPGEMLAYWTTRYGRAIPKPVKRGVADAAARLYNERALIKYDGESKGFRFGDVLDLTHPEPTAAWQGDLFKYAIDRRHGRADEVPESLPILTARAKLLAIPASERRSALSDSEALTAAGMTWESLAAWLGGPMDKAAWESIIPSMGSMALVRNLRNFDAAGVSDEVAEKVCATISDPVEVIKSRQLPMRYLSAYRAVPSLRWANALEKALQASLASVPVLPGRTLILWDCSGSMDWGKVSDRTALSFKDVAGVFCGALALRAENPTLVQYGNGHTVVPVRKGGSVLPLISSAPNMGGTQTWATVRATFKDHDRVIIVTDEQSHDNASIGSVPNSVPLYVWNLAGYGVSTVGAGKNRWTFGGLSDKGFNQIEILEGGGVGSWPWEK